MEHGTATGNTIEVIELPRELPRQEELNRAAIYVEQSVSALKIDSHGMYEIAAIELQDLQGRKKALEEKRMGITRKFDESKRAVMDLFRDPVARMEAAIDTLKRAMLTYQQDQERIRAEEQRKADEAARAARLKLEQEQLAQRAEAERIEREQADQRRLADEAAQRVRDAEAAGDRAAQERAAAELLASQQAEAKLQTEREAAQASALVAQHVASVMSAPSVAPAMKVAGITTSAPWTAELINDSDENKLALLKYVLDNPQYIGFIDVNMKPIIQQAKSLQDKMQIPGVRAIQVPRLASRAKK